MLLALVRSILRLSSIKTHDVIIHHFISLQYNFKNQKKSYKVSGSLILVYVITSVVTITFNKNDLRLLRL